MLSNWHWQKTAGGVSKKMSQLENSEEIDEETLKIVAEKLGVTPEFIKNFNDEKNYLLYSKSQYF
ncbi:hypothetical protein [Algoriphagus boritolerans]|uniref:hypothetical protein n=1 Tax=Algoriphagus boritolerans TaxID=308111 RepID=UPI000AD7C6B2